MKLWQIIVASIVIILTMISAYLDARNDGLNREKALKRTIIVGAVCTVAIILVITYI